MTVKQILDAIKNSEVVYHIWEINYHTNPGPQHVMVAGLVPVALKAEITYTGFGRPLKRYEVQMQGTQPLPPEALFATEAEAKQAGVDQVNGYFEKESKRLTNANQIDQLKQQSRELTKQRRI